VRILISNFQTDCLVVLVPSLDLPYHWISHSATFRDGDMRKTVSTKLRWLTTKT